MSIDPPAMSSLSPALSVADCNCVSLRRASRRISVYYDACLAPAGLRATQFAMMEVLRRGEGMSVQALAGKLDMDRSTAGQNVKLLERDRMIEIVPSASDGRARLIRLTSEGHRRLSAARSLWEKAQRRFEEANGAANTAAMRAMVKDLQVPEVASDKPTTA